jgi:release factor glutamine methyltransferase
VLGWDRAAIVTRAGERPPAAAVDLFRTAVGERSRRRPLQHLTSVQAFWRHEFAVTPDVLIPRPETELLVETGLALLAGSTSPVVVDVGTGSGCIALSIAAERPDAVVHATDSSPAALRVARANAARLGLVSRVEFHEGDLLAPLRAHGGAIDLVLSNPPYVSAEEWAGLEPEVRDHDPRMALVPPEGVAAIYARLIREAAGLLRRPGWLAVEIGAGLLGTVSDRMAEAGLGEIDSRNDLAGIPRVVLARRPAARGTM